ncbi:hypothetical protein GQ457_05G018520 [Hibiscus cannabinus]
MLFMIYVRRTAGQNDSQAIHKHTSHHTMQCHHAMHPTTTDPQAIGSYPTRKNQGQFHDSLNIPLRSRPRLTRGRTYDSLDISKHNLNNISSMLRSHSIISHPC